MKLNLELKEEDDGYEAILISRKSFSHFPSVRDGVATIFPALSDFCSDFRADKHSVANVNPLLAPLRDKE